MNVDGDILSEPGYIKCRGDHLPIDHYGHVRTWKFQYSDNAVVFVLHGIQHWCSQTHINLDHHVGINPVFYQGFSDVFSHRSI